MKVLLISHTAMSRTAGQPKLHCLATHNDIELTVLVPDRMNFYGKWEEAELPIDPNFRFVVGRARWQRVAGQWYLQHYVHSLGPLLREIQPDIVDIWQEPWSLVCAQAINLTRRLCPNAKILVETEQNIYKRLPPPFQQFQNYSLRHADFLVGRSREALDVAKRKGYTGPAQVVPNAVDTDLFRPAVCGHEEKRDNHRDTETQREKQGTGDREQGIGKREWGAGEASFLIGYVGRLVPEKGLADAVGAMALLPKDCQLLLIGEGPMRGALEAQAIQQGVEERVHFAGAVSYTVLPAFLNGLDVLVLPSRTTLRWKEQFGRVLIEVGACGIPVIGSDSGAIPEVVGEAGLIFPEGDVSALAEAIGMLRENEAMRHQMGAEGRRRAETLFSWQAVAAQMAEIYRKMLK